MLELKFEIHLEKLPNGISSYSIWH